MPTLLPLPVFNWIGFLFFLFLSADGDVGVGIDLPARGLVRGAVDRMLILLE